MISLKPYPAFLSTSYSGDLFLGLQAFLCNNKLFFILFSGVVTVNFYK